MILVSDNLYPSELKLDWVIEVFRVSFCLGNGDNEIISPNLDSGILTVQLEYFDNT